MHGAYAVALLVAACSSTLQPPSPATSIPTALASIAPASLTISASGEFCGPWWMGCGAYLAVESPGWTLPEDWTPSAGDTLFDVALRPGSDAPARVTGVSEQGRDRIEPGEYRFVVIVTRSPDTLPRTFSASVGCSRDVTIPPGTQAVSVDVEFGYNQAPCTITASSTPS